MTNFEYLQKCSLEELALTLVGETLILDEDENFDGDWEYTYEYGYSSLDGEKFYYENDAIEHNIKWLNEEFKNE